MLRREYVISNGNRHFVIAKKSRTWSAPYVIPITREQDKKRYKDLSAPAHKLWKLRMNAETAAFEKGDIAERALKDFSRKKDGVQPMLRLKFKEQSVVHNVYYTMHSYPPVKVGNQNVAPKVDFFMEYQPAPNRVSYPSKPILRLEVDAKTKSGLTGMDDYCVLQGSVAQFESLKKSSGGQYWCLQWVPNKEGFFIHIYEPVTIINRVLYNELYQKAEQERERLRRQYRDNLASARARSNDGKYGAFTVYR